MNRELVLNSILSHWITVSFAHARKMSFMVIFIVTEKGRISCLTRTCTTNSATTSSPRSEGCKKERWKLDFGTLQVLLML